MSDKVTEKTRPDPWGYLRNLREAAAEVETPGYDERWNEEFLAAWGTCKIAGLATSEFDGQLSCQLVADGLRCALDTIQSAQLKAETIDEFCEDLDDFIASEYCADILRMDFHLWACDVAAGEALEKAIDDWNRDADLIHDQFERFQEARLALIETMYSQREQFAVVLESVFLDNLWCVICEDHQPLVPWWLQPNRLAEVAESLHETLAGNWGTRGVKRNYVIMVPFDRTIDGKEVKDLARIEQVGQAGNPATKDSLSFIAKSRTKPSIEISFDLRSTHCSSDEIVFWFTMELDQNATEADWKIEARFGPNDNWRPVVNDHGSPVVRVKVVDLDAIWRETATAQVDIRRHEPELPEETLKFRIEEVG